MKEIAAERKKNHEELINETIEEHVKSKIKENVKNAISVSNLRTPKVRFGFLVTQPCSIMITLISSEAVSTANQEAILESGAMQVKKRTLIQLEVKLIKSQVKIMCSQML